MFPIFEGLMLLYNIYLSDFGNIFPINDVKSCSQKEDLNNSDNQYYCSAAKCVEIDDNNNRFGFLEDCI